MAVCPFCREAIAQHDVHACPSCQTPHHAVCWQENRGCTVFGCPCAPPDEPKVSISSASVGGSRYLLARHGQQFGPYTMEELRRFVAERRTSDSDLVWTEGLPQWVPLRQVAGLGQSIAPRPHHAAPSPYARSPVKPPVLGGYGAPSPLYGASQPHGVIKPATHMLPAILVTVLCCIPFGIVSIVYASQVDTKFRAGDYAGALSASSTARNWYLAALCFGLTMGLISLLLTLRGSVQ